MTPHHCHLFSPRHDAWHDFSQGTTSTELQLHEKHIREELQGKQQAGKGLNQFPLPAASSLEMDLPKNTLHREAAAKALQHIKLYVQGGVLSLILSIIL